MQVTALGITMDDRLIQPEKALSPIYVTELPIDTDDKLVNPENASLPINVIVFPIDTLVNPVQPDIAFHVICFTELGMFKEATLFKP